MLVTHATPHTLPNILCRVVLLDEQRLDEYFHTMDHRTQALHVLHGLMGDDDDGEFEDQDHLRGSV